MSQPYLSIEAELHDAFWEAEDDASEVRLMADFLKRHPGPSLEIGSGSGRLMFPLLKAGFGIEGLELSADMRALGVERARRLDVCPVVHAGDMTTWQPRRRYAAVLAPAFTLQLAADPGAVLRHWHGWLENLGGLYVTVFMPYAELLGDLPEGVWYPDHQADLCDGRHGFLETRHRIDRDRQLLHREHRYTLSGVGDAAAVRHESRQTIRWIEHGEMLDLLKNSGFSLQRYCLDFDPEHTPADPESVDFGGVITYHATRSRAEP